jgi:hypothetical protein
MTATMRYGPGDIRVEKRGDDGYEHAHFHGGPAPVR